MLDDVNREWSDEGDSTVSFHQFLFQKKKKKKETNMLIKDRQT